MERVTGPTVDTDLHGTGKDGFTEGNPPVPPATIVTDDVTNAWQEELARAVELGGSDLTPGVFTQMHDTLQRHAAAAMFGDSAPLAGQFHPQQGASLGGTFWVTQTAGLTGAVQPGSAWIDLGNDQVGRVAIDTADIASQSFDAFVFTAFRDSYVAINNAGLIEINDVANGGGAPVPTAGFTNVFFVVTDGTDITSVQSVLDTWPSQRVQSIRFTNVLSTDRPAGNERGFLMELDDTATPFFSIRPQESATARERFWIVTDVASGGQASDQEWRGSFRWTPSSHTDPRFQYRTHDGSTAEDTRFAEHFTLVGNITGAGVAEVGRVPLPHDGCNAFVLIAAVHSTDATRSYSAIHSALLQSGGVEVGSAALHSNDSAGAGIFTQVVTDGTDVIVEASAVAAQTWRFTVILILIPADVTA